MVQIDLVRTIHQVVEHPRGDVPHIRGPLAQVFVIDGFERRGVSLGDLLKRVIDVDHLPLHQPGNFVNECAVFEDQQMRIENAGVLRAHGLPNLALDVQNLVTGLDESLFQTFPFPRQFALLNRLRGNRGVALPKTRFCLDKPRRRPEFLLRPVLR